jgi:hypothetical protein
MHPPWIVLKLWNILIIKLTSSFQFDAVSRAKKQKVTETIDAPAEAVSNGQKRKAEDDEEEVSSQMSHSVQEPVENSQAFN